MIQRTLQKISRTHSLKKLASTRPDLFSITHKFSNLRFFSETPKTKQTTDIKENQPIDDSFFEEDNEYDFKSNRIFLLKKNLPKINKSLNKAYYYGGFGFLSSAYLLIIDYTLFAGIMGVLGAVPMIRVRKIKDRLERVVYEINLSENKKTVEIHYGINKKVLKTPISKIEPIRSEEMPDGGFQAFIEVEDDLKNKRHDLHISVSNKFCDIPNMNLLTAVITGEEEEVQKFNKLLKDINDLKDDN